MEKVKDMKKKYAMMAVAAVLVCSCGEKKDTQGYQHSVYVTDLAENGENGGRLAASGEGEGAMAGNEGTGAEVSEAGSGEKGEERVYAGIVEEAHLVSLGFKTPGQIEKIFVKEGDYVKKGQLLAQLDDEDYKLGVEAVQIQYDQVKDEVGRAKRLFDKQSMSANDYEKASAGLRQLGVQLEVNKNKLAYTKLYAPTSGYIKSVNFSPSEMVDAGTAVFGLLDVSGMEVVVDVPATVYDRRGDFSSFSCRRSNGEGEEVALRYVSIVPSADSNQLYRMRLSAGKGAGLTSGMSVEVKIGMKGGAKGGSGYVTVPVSAIWSDGEGQACVWVVEADSTVTKRPVSVERRLSGKNIRITSGLEGDEKVVRAGVNVLQPGEKVNIISAPAATNVGGLL